MSKLTAFAILIALVSFPASYALAGSLEPPSAPAPTMKTLQEIWDKIECTPAPCPDPNIVVGVPKTGQTESYGDQDDGELQRGVAWPDPRFTDNGDGTVTDNLTNLVWLKNANCFGTRDWATALADANGLADGACGLTDGSAAGDWWLPNVRQLHSLVDYGIHAPALPPNPFSEFRSSDYWSSTSDVGYTDFAWLVNMHNGRVYNGFRKTNTYHVWPVRAGQ